MYELYFIRIKELVDEKRSTVDINMNVSSLLQKDKFVLNKKLLMISEKKFWKIIFFKQSKYMYLSWPFFFIKRS
jgi:hypothetical protein